MMNIGDQVYHRNLHKSGKVTNIHSVVVLFDDGEEREVSIPLLETGRSCISE